MMKIEILKQGKFTTSGSSVLKMMQNNNTPVIDLIVRESIQNSLDAALPNVNSVGVSFSCKEFDVEQFSNHFVSIKDTIKKKVGSNKAKYLSIHDFNTIGLVGNLDGNFDPGEKKQNLGKLVFHIMKAQDQEGAGGSWGIGKTVYYRLGIGLVCYYSRVKLDDGTFQERLVAALVENETYSDGLLSNYEKNLGVAFFGEDENNEGTIKAIVKEEYIHKFLSVFNIKPYEGVQTGTIVIIPFIDENKMLENSMVDGIEKTWWQTEVANYLKVSILRWYFPRLANNYSYGPKLVVAVNGTPVFADKNSPLFSKMIDLYNAAFLNEFSNWIKKESIIRKTNVKEKELGYFVYGKVTKDELGMVKQHLPSPYDYVLLDSNDENQQNDPIICFCRKPGMIVNYEHNGICTGGIKTDKNEFIIGIFVLNSKNYIELPEYINLDEYIRQSEKSDHTSWSDHPIGKVAGKIQIVSQINKSIGKVLSINYGDEKPVSGDVTISTNLANKFGKLLLPENGFGKSGSTKPGKGSKRSGSGLTVLKKKNLVEFVDLDFKGDSVHLTYQIRLITPNKKIKFVNKISTIQGMIDATNWEEKGLIYPCEIDKIAIKCGNDIRLYSTQQGHAKYDNYLIDFLFTNSNKCYGFEMINDKFEAKNLIIKISLKSSDKLIQTNFDIDLEEK